MSAVEAHAMAERKAAPRVDRPSEDAPALAMAGARKHFGRVRALEGLDLRIERGETVALLGPNGAGKTTTLALALGLLHPDAGSVRIWGRAPRRAITEGRVAAMLQRGGLTTGVTVRELVDFVRALYREPRNLDDVLAAVGLQQAADRLVTRLSGGQTQRLRLALVLVGDPGLLILDEPTAGMDVEARRGFWGAMHAHVDAGRTVVFATHYLKEADEAADRIVLVQDGRIIADGPAPEIKAAAGGRSVRFVLPADASRDTLGALPGVSRASVRGRTATLYSTDADATVKALLRRYPEVSDLEVAGADLEDAFLALTERS